MNKALKLLSILPFCLSSTAFANDTCYVSYYDFENIVPHVDIEICPGMDVNMDENFCRIGVSLDHITVYRFEYGDKQNCMVAAKTYQINDFIHEFGAIHTVEE